MNVREKLRVSSEDEVLSEGECVRERGEVWQGTEV